MRRAAWACFRPVLVPRSLDVRSELLLTAHQFTSEVFWKVFWSNNLGTEREKNIHNDFLSSRISFSANRKSFLRLCERGKLIIMQSLHLFTFEIPCAAAKRQIAETFSANLRSFYCFSSSSYFKIGKFLKEISISFVQDRHWILRLIYWWFHSAKNSFVFSFGFGIFACSTNYFQSSQFAFSQFHCTSIQLLLYCIFYL